MARDRLSVCVVLGKRSLTLKVDSADSEDQREALKKYTST
jgi:hypothetical protein